MDAEIDPREELNSGETGTRKHIALSRCDCCPLDLSCLSRKCTTDLAVLFIQSRNLPFVRSERG